VSKVALEVVSVGLKHPKQDSTRVSTKKANLERLPTVVIENLKAMGFDVIYFPPIHPIGFNPRN